MKSLLFLIIPILFACSSSENNDSKPLVLNAHSMVYHPKETNVYLFGGANEKEVLNDLWVLQDYNWQKVKTDQSPPPRTFASMTYDKNENRIILFGGSKVLFGNEPNGMNLLNDTWEFKNSQWNKIDTKSTPSPRAEAEIVYDPATEKIILFGGYVIENGEYIKLGDTWEFTNDNWVKVASTGPSARHGVSMAYDPLNQKVLLFGGSTTDKQYGQSSGESWVYKDQKWTYLDIVQPSGIFNANMVYDKANGQFIRFGGWDGNTRINETWSFKNEKWELINTPNSPTPRNHSRMVFNEKDGKVILFGGHNGREVLGDIWEFKGDQWKRILNVKPILRIENNH